MPARLIFTQQDAEKFAKVWNQASSLEAVAKVFGITKRSASVRARHFRVMGCKLQEFKGGLQEFDWTTLRLIAAKTLNKEQALYARKGDPTHHRVLAKQSFLKDFIVVWQKSMTSNAVDRRFKLTPDRRTTIAAWLRTKGVPLKRFKSKVQFNWPMLQQTAVTLLEDIAAGRIKLEGTRHKKEPKL